jgi:hypothetical protein
MKIIRKLLPGAAILRMAFSVAATAEGAASASTVPVKCAAHADGSWIVRATRRFAGIGTYRRETP